MIHAFNDRPICLEIRVDPAGWRLLAVRDRVDWVEMRPDPREPDRDVARIGGFDRRERTAQMEDDRVRGRVEDGQRGVVPWRPTSRPLP